MLGAPAVKVWLVVLDEIDERGLAAEENFWVGDQIVVEIGCPPGSGKKHITGAEIEPAAGAIVSVDENAWRFVVALKEGLRSVVGEARIALRRNVGFGYDDAPVEF